MIDGRRSGLLVSVRSAAEAEVALAAGADWIDVKEPWRGALGAAEFSSIEEVAGAVRGRAPLSAALGELVDWSVRRPVVPDGVCMAKFGLAGCAADANWQDSWRQAVGHFSESVAPVAVVYADWQAVAAPPPQDVLAAGLRLGCRAVLIDTFDKSRGNLLDRWPRAGLAEFVARVREHDLLLVLGGSLSETSIVEIQPLRADYVAVRTAACRGGREGRIDPDRVRRLRELLDEQNVAWREDKFDPTSLTFADEN